MSDKPKTITRLTDYTPPLFLVESIHLEFQLHDEETHVYSRMLMHRNPQANASNHQPLCLDGRELELLQIRLDGQPLSQDRFEMTDQHLLIHGLPDSFELVVATRIQPQKNLSLEGLYRSGTLFCTQCEAEGFRKITYYPDRPDVMARFTVTVEADQATLPVLLSNGNLLQTGTKPNQRHFAVWEDPFPKPAYLFALVAGNLVCQQDHFVTCSGRDVTLQVWVEPENADKCQHALDSLKKAMTWDEVRFGREYDLDLYMIVAVNDFNMGAMENKGLNIFNAKYVLADPEMATDANYEEIESVIAHEYFHNWTGNRITCRDWFQLSLKEGLTIFRDQEFSAEVGSSSLQRIRDVQDLRTHQFPEDAGPIAHAVRPETYMEINNFYTMTVYNKGAEVVRMLQILIGKEAFRKGMDLYFQRHDGQAVTVEAFIQAMESASGRTLTQFMRWYQQPGTPEVAVSWSHAPDTGRLELTFEQTCRLANQEESAPPFHIPMTLALMDATTGIPLPLMLEGSHSVTPSTEVTLELTHHVETFCFTDIRSAPIPSVLRGFSAPVKIRAPFSDADLAFLWGADGDSFNRWDAGQELATRVLLQAAQNGADQEIKLPSLFLRAFSATLEDTRLDPALSALALALPGLNLLVEKMVNADPAALYRARHSVLRQLAVECQKSLLLVHAANQTPGPYQRDPVSMGRRSLKNLILSLLMALPDNDLPARMAVEQLRNADNMTDRLGALIPLVHAGRAESQEVLDEMEQKWHTNPLVMDKWFAIQASAPLDDTLTCIQRLMKKPTFDVRNPNKVRALIGTFCHQNLSRFHDSSGSGYQFLVEQILTLDPINPQVAARLASAFSRWRRFEPMRQRAMQLSLQQIIQSSGLSRDTYEIVSKSLT
ncbi:MAG: aminopeptidase N [Magnetococcus sp. YQC-5]